MPKMHQNTLGELIPQTPYSLFLNYNQHFANFKPKGFRVLFDITASVCFISKNIRLYFSTENGPPGERALCQLYRHTFVPRR